MAPAISVIIPARAEAETIGGTLEALFAALTGPAEVLVVVDDVADPTRAAVCARAGQHPGLRCLVSSYRPGPAGAIRCGMNAASAPVAVVMMADGCDDPRQVAELASLVRRGAVVAAASRYAPGGARLGGPLVKGLLSRLAGRSLHRLAGLPTSDATNSFKAYSLAFVREVGVASRRGFTIGIELAAKAHRLGLPVAEIPTTWRERDGRVSGFRLLRWLPDYLRWYAYCFGPRLDIELVRVRGGAAGPVTAGVTATGSPG
jgi:dolichol-phosphate mannosyltransferase